MSDQSKSSLPSTLLGQLTSDDEQLEITIRKATNEVILRNPKDDKIVTIKATVDADENEAVPAPLKERKPLTPEEFEEALGQLDSLGLRFTVGLHPGTEAIDENSEQLIDGNALTQLQSKYPTLPSEAGLVAHNTLTGKRYGVDFLGGEEVYEKKAAIVNRLLLTDHYREEFFFKHALKVPSYENLDWEVVLKTHERGVDDVAGMPYALLMLTLRDPMHSPGRPEFQQFVSIALNRSRLAQMLAELTKVMSSLESSFKIRDSWNAVQGKESTNV